MLIFVVIIQQENIEFETWIKQDITECKQNIQELPERDHIPNICWTFLRLFVFVIGFMVFIFGLITDLGDITYNYIFMGVGGSMIIIFVSCLLYLTRRVYCCCCYKSGRGLKKYKNKSNKSQQEPLSPPAVLKRQEQHIHRIYGDDADTEL